MYEVPDSKVHKLEKIINFLSEKSLGCAALYGNDIPELPLSGLAEEFKCAKARPEMTAVQ